MSKKTADAVSGVKTYRRLLSYVRPYWKAFALAIVCNGAYGFLDTEFIKGIRILLDDGFAEKNAEFLILAPAFVIGILFFRGLAGFIAAYCMAWVGN